MSQEETQEYFKKGDYKVDIDRTKDILRYYKKLGIGSQVMSRQIKIEEITYNI